MSVPHLALPIAVANTDGSPLSEQPLSPRFRLSPPTFPLELRLEVFRFAIDDTKRSTDAAALAKLLRTMSLVSPACLGSPLTGRSAAAMTLTTSCLPFDLQTEARRNIFHTANLQRRRFYTPEVVRGFFEAVNNNLKLGTLVKGILCSLDTTYWILAMAGHFPNLSVLCELPWPESTNRYPAGPVSGHRPALAELTMVADWEEASPPPLTIWYDLGSLQTFGFNCQLE